jgi:hypothetical protein
LLGAPQCDGGVGDGSKCAVVKIHQTDSTLIDYSKLQAQLMITEGLHKRIHIELYSTFMKTSFLNKRKFISRSLN